MVAAQGTSRRLRVGTCRGGRAQQHKRASRVPAAAAAGMVEHHKDLVYRTGGAEECRQLSIGGAWRHAIHLQGNGRLRGDGWVGRGSCRRRRGRHFAATAVA